MKLIINKDRSVIQVGTWGTKNENDFEIVDFEFPEELEGYNKRIVYLLGGGNNPWGVIDRNNKAYITSEITSKENVKGYVWCTKGNPDRPADTDFRSREFDIPFYENENATGVVPTPQQIDGFNTMLTEMNAKIDEVDALETTIGAAEAERQEAEATRVSNENTRESNESTRQTNEQTRQTQEADRERRTDEAIADIEDKTAEYNANAEAKTNEFNQNATQKTNEFNSNYTQKTNEFNSNYTQKVNDFNTNATTQETDFNSNASSKTSAFNSNAETKTNAFNTNATNKTNDFNSNATEKTTTFNDNASTKISEFNTNAESKTSAFNDNVTQKTTNFDNNASEKTDEFNTNAQNKIDEYDEHIVEYQAQIDELQEEVGELSENMPWNTTEQATEISVDDAAKYSKNKLELFGNTSQVSTSGSQAIDYSEVINKKVDFSDVTLLISTTNFNIKADTTYYIRWIFTDDTYVNASSTLDNIRLYNGTSIQKQFGGTNIAFTSQELDGITSIQVRATTTFASTYAGKTIKALVFSSDVNKITPDTYESYTGGQPSPSPDYPQDIHVVTGNNTIKVQGKNLFDKNVERKNAFSTGDIGQVVGYGNSSASYSYVNCAKVEANKTYTLSWKIDGTKGATSNRNSKIVDSNNIVLEEFATWINNTTHITFTPQNTGYLVLTTDVSSVDIQLEQGSTVTSYVPYYHADYPINLGSIELCKIGVYKDEIFKNEPNNPHYDSSLVEGSWYKYGVIKKAVLNGNEYWFRSDGNNDYRDYRVYINNIALANKSPIGYIADLFSALDSTHWNDFDEHVVQMNNGSFSFRIDVTRLSENTLEGFKTWISTHNITLYYALKTPAITQIIDETLISQLDAIYEHLQLVKGTNNITVTAEDLAPYMKLSYMQDIKSKLDNLDSRLALLE